ncbi:hypothetical protein [Arthrobacter sp.]|uniref:hypothetical protein n=1 Tax=Arthrobacter sp. TaxID=1667 RepID=UPI002811B668|nr:hypothetical protein [Arthrobacter sp.]
MDQDPVRLTRLEPFSGGGLGRRRLVREVLAPSAAIDADDLMVLHITSGVPFDAFREGHPQP